MNDDEFVAAVLGGTLPPAQFHHRDHLRLAWLLVRRHGRDDAGRAVTTGIRRFAAQHGQTTLYHETITQFWVGIVGHAVTVQPEIADFVDFLAAFPHLLDKGLPARHWRQETLAATAARTAWVEPDLRAVPPMVAPSV